MAYRIEITPTALEALETIADRRTRSAIIRRIDTLSEEPDMQGKPLLDLLAGFLTVRAAGQRYQILDKVDNVKQQVLIYMVGIRRQDSRRDVYDLAERLVRRGLI